MLKHWFKYETEYEQKNVNLICFSHAGGSARAYIPWKQYLPIEVGLLPVQLPMRENRIRDKMPENIQSIVKQIVDENTEVFKKPFALFGHSLGSFFAFETAVYCQENLGVEPEAMFVSGTVDPAHSKEKGKMLDLDDGKLLRTLLNFDGTEQQLLENKSFRDYLLPILRTDFRLFREYKNTAQQVHCPIYSYSGSRDPFAMTGEVEKWRNFTNAQYSHKEFTGGHFYMNQHTEELCHDILRKLKLTGGIRNAV
ncbi:thioesterase II family protein [Ruminococcus albus]|uniref:Oleoyl-(Acyl-carrier-protein) hydrolase n=1 Tax=Ruminococcus albus (strain ATCC 27210 / DSM 20455 / JCM 14654 / NCDO 2250 / 7) TaxID=697329 RepID=E6UAS8_RUMA7|nr:thioesterase domain-containing protein [Ruminococcus albus]ADU21407.1 Oleoyl-(acyl-carrier-protein) hydrolase [Ruminococcus albus 7 = DSM 20455]